MREVVVRVGDHHADDQIVDDDVAQHAALPAKGPRSRFGPESLGVAGAIRRLGVTRCLPLPIVFRCVAWIPAVAFRAPMRVTSLR